MKLTRVYDFQLKLTTVYDFQSTDVK